MRENDKITDIFRNRLSGAEMTVREGFWEELQRSLPQTMVPAGEEASEPSLPSASAVNGKRLTLSPRFYRVAAAASVVFVLGAASAAFWYFSPKEEIKEAFTQVATMTPDGSLKGDVVQESFPSIHKANPTAQKPGAKQPASGIPAGLTAQTEDDDESVSVHVSITITQRVYGNSQQAGNGHYNNSAQNGTYRSTADHAGTGSDANSASSVGEASAAKTASAWKSRNWAVKAAMGSSLPKGDYHMPLTAGLSVERRLNDRFSLEAGVQYNRLDADNATLHTLGIPVRLDMMLASSSKVDFYAMAGGTAEKCIAGAPDNGFSAEPVQLSVAAGVGVRYKMNDRVALFAEPSVSHHFDTDSKTRTLRTERPTNLNLLCGVRVTY
ncbi:outer membrane beta-barrel protein [Bacteroides sp. GD17]|jgi:hypothetical protein|uniref:outer membrane beta-barrel protein n=1 Tax=Bacteroides sp. GD17 TaxID=3139826 RepID=UPI00313E1291